MDSFASHTPDPPPPHTHTHTLTTLSPRPEAPIMRGTSILTAKCLLQAKERKKARKKKEKKKEISWTSPHHILRETAFLLFFWNISHDNMHEINTWSVTLKHSVPNLFIASTLNSASINSLIELTYYNSLYYTREDGIASQITWQSYPWFYLLIILIVLLLLGSILKRHIILLYALNPDNYK